MRHKSARLKPETSRASGMKIQKLLFDAARGPADAADAAVGKDGGSEESGAV